MGVETMNRLTDVEVPPTRNASRFDLRTRGRLIALTAFLLTSCTAINAVTTSATVDLSALKTKTPAGTYIYDNPESSLIFKVRHFNFSQFVGRFDTVESTLQWDPANVAASKLEVSVDVASVDTHVSTLDTELRDVFGAKQCPKAHFVSTQVTVTSKNTGEVAGDLTINGQTHPTTLHVIFNGGDINGLTNKPTLGFSATTVINRSEWGMGKWFPIVGNDVKLEIEAEFAKAS